MTGNDQSIWSRLAAQAEEQLFANILPFWINQVPEGDNIGYHGLIRNDGSCESGASKGLVMHARLLWSFSAAARFSNKVEYREAADKALFFLRNKLADPIHGGYWWHTDSAGIPTDRNKVVYGQAFAIYGLCEALRLSGDERLRREAEELFKLMETRARDSEKGGYLEVLSEDWSPHPDGRLSSEDIPCHKSMNTNLHVMEAYTNYYRVRPEPIVAEALTSLIRWFVEKIYDPDRRHLILFLDESGLSMKDVDSYGHDIEAAWLLREAIEVVGDEKLKSETGPVLAALAEAVLTEGFSCADGGLDYERDGTHRDTDRHWWVQAEAVVGFRDCWEVSGEDRWAAAAEATWKYIMEHLADDKEGEWFWGVQADGSLMEKEKGGLWKTPYHNGRACMELMERIHGSHAEIRNENQEDSE